MASELETILTFPESRIVVVGDLILDRFVYGEVERMSREAPVPVLRVTGESYMLGGAGNSARNVTQMGAQATLVTVVGDDDAGRHLARLAAGEPRLKVRLLTDGSRKTTVKTRFACQGQQLLRVDAEEPIVVDGAMAAELMAALGEALDDADMLICSDYGNGVLGRFTIQAAISCARERGLPVVVDPKYSDSAHYQSATVITPNLQEASQITNRPCRNDHEVEEAARSIAEKTHCQFVVITRGADGLTVLDNAAGNSVVKHLRTVAREVRDVAGAGDTVVAALALALNSGASIELAAHIANLAAGIAVRKSGTSPVTSRELVSAVQMKTLLPATEKVVSLETALARTSGWRKRGERVVFTNGCFDLLHPGHVHVLQQARAEGDRLIVGVNSDESVRRLKGAERPIQGESARTMVIASIDVVDLVIVFTEDTPIDLIETLRPDVLVKGADYTEDQVVGGDVVKANGGRVVLVALLEGHSTTGTIRAAAVRTSKSAGDEWSGAKR
ncbi:MAG: D-glycero-beta-D-manno-heptose 1-phosphate adenylyltransferase [Alphaproteobacteria bacterium]|nr:D-glycero-beta-D-manno-heptose 1-phosphate adenylyltransferase [Alphaproteobacteria bacterium]